MLIMYPCSHSSYIYTRKTQYRNGNRHRDPSPVTPSNQELQKRKKYINYTLWNSSTIYIQQEQVFFCLLIMCALLTYSYKTKTLTLNHLHVSFEMVYRITEPTCFVHSFRSLTQFSYNNTCLYSDVIDCERQKFWATIFDFRLV